MDEGKITPSRTPVEEELIGRVAWQIRLRWFAALGVLAGAWFATSIPSIQLPQGSLYAIGLGILAYNALFWLYLRRLERATVAQASVFGRFAQIQTSLDWAAMILLVHCSGGVQSPFLFFFFFHLILAAILFSRRACYLFASLAALAVAGLAGLEYAGLVPHVSSGIVAVPLYRTKVYVASVLVFFTSAMYISVYLATSVTINLRQKDKELLRLQRNLAAAYQRIQTLYDVSSSVSSTLDLEEVLNLIAQNATEAMQVKACTIRLLDERSQAVETLAAYGLSRQFLTKGPIDVQKSIVTRQALSGQTTIVADIARDDRLQYAAKVLTEGINSMLCVPLIIRGKAEGVICIYSAEPSHFDHDDAEFLSALASEGASAIVNARAYQALEVADRAKSEFVRMVTHELRSPLSAVQSMLRLMEQGYVGPLTEKQQDLVQRSQRRISFLLALVKDLLELAAGKMEKLKGEKNVVVLNEMIAKVTDLLQASAQEKGLDYQVEITDEPLTVTGVQDGLERVFMNLVNNAVKYTPAGGSVSVRAWGEGDQCRFVVSDSGIGIPAEAQPRIFGEFYRAKNAKALEMEGTGLGLAIAKGVVEQHGGRISFDSEEGKGTTFYVSLPLSALEREAA